MTPILRLTLDGARRAPSVPSGGAITRPTREHVLEDICWRSVVDATDAQQLHLLLRSVMIYDEPRTRFARMSTGMVASRGTDPSAW